VSATVRGELERLLREAPRTARDLSREAGIPERDVYAHLPHVERSVRARGGRLEIEPARCLACDFTFRERRRFARPGRGPVCKERRLTLPRFSVREGDGSHS